MDFSNLKQLVLNSPGLYKTRPHIWHRYLSMIEPEDLCLEFGVWRGASINYMANVRPDNTFHGFDSFEGLPEDWIKVAPKGYFKTDREALKFRPNVIIHAGWFNDTLPEFLASLEGNVNPIKFVHIDCDLGSSTETVLGLLERHIIANKAVLLFDEFYNYAGYEKHEFLAFMNFVNRTGVSFEVMGRNVAHQQCLIQIL